MKEIFKQNVITQMSNYSELVVATHNFAFHADDVFCIALLKELETICNFKLKVIRTRDESLLRTADMRVDVGLKYSEETLDFDHHQNDQSLIQEEGIKHSAFGLLCQWCMNEDFLKIYKRNCVLGLEYQDNTGKIHEKYSSIGNFIYTFLPAYEEQTFYDEMFDEAVLVASIILRRSLITTLGFLKAENDAQSAITEKIANEKIIVMNKRVVIQHFLHPNWRFIISPDPSGGWGFLGINGQLIKENLRGLNPHELEKRGYKGKFIHIGGFTGILDELKDVKEICINSLNENTCS